VRRPTRSSAGKSGGGLRLPIVRGSEYAPTGVRWDVRSWHNPAALATGQLVRLLG
jgi:hypothetical protein